ncbi:MAG: response regulator [Actinomycetota bacterium]|nr:response regulator [Actinomycetota bacterium]
MTNPSSSWSAQHLAEFLAAVSAPQDSECAIRLGVERAAESLDAEVAALLRDEAVAASIGFPSGRAPEAELVAAAASSDGLAAFPGLGPCSVTVAPVAETEHLLVARLGSDGFIHEETQLLRAMARVLSLTLDSLALLERERRIQQRLATSERQTRLIVETAHDAFVAIDSDGLIIDCNPQAEATFGWPSEQMLGSQLAELLIPEGYREAHRRGLERFLATGDGPILGRRLELSALHRDGHEFPIEFTVSPLQTEEGYRFNAFLRDITERREIERRKDEFTSVVSHELRTPLTSIRGSLGLLASGVLGPLPEKGQRMIEIAVENTDRLVRLINDILDIERMDSGRIDMHKQSCDAADLVSAAAESLQSLAAEARVTLGADAASATVFADRDRILQALTNLISNAVKFSPPDSTVHVSSRRLDGEVLFQVTDEGRGIPADMLDSVFGRFQQVDASDAREKGGTGLGLAICRSIVERHGGRIWVESVPGEGSTFYFVLPALDEHDHTNGNRAVSSGPAVLVCDNDASLVEVVGAMLAERGYRAIAATSGEQALERALAERPDAILLDLLMPGMSGWETAAALRERPETCEIPIVILSGLSPGEGGTPSAPVADWLEKPIDRRALFEALERAVAGHSEPFKVLVVEDDRDLAGTLSAMFESHGIQAFEASSGRRAIELAQQVRPDLLTLDIGLPEADGFEVVDWLRGQEYLSALPMIVYTARDLDQGDRERLRLGQTTEFLTKARISPKEFEGRVMALLARLTRDRTPETVAQP